jgi:hypothetical protein
VLQIFTTLKNSLPSAKFEPANLGCNGKHTNHHNTKDNKGEIPGTLTLIRE